MGYDLARPSAALKDGRVAGKMVLIVDDDRDSLEWMAMALESAGFSVATAVKVERAVDALEAGLRPAVIVTDLAMPQRDGWDFVRYLGKDPELRSIPVVVTSGRTQAEARVAADVFLQKPVTPEQLVSAVASLARGV